MGIVTVEANEQETGFTGNNGRQRSHFARSAQLQALWWRGGGFDLCITHALAIPIVLASLSRIPLPELSCIDGRIRQQI
ncbi:MAG: hypothetical protein WA446_19055 [Steroidobacteraceae bacterium]